MPLYSEIFKQEKVELPYSYYSASRMFCVPAYCLEVGSKRALITMYKKAISYEPFIYQSKRIKFPNTEKGLNHIKDNLKMGQMTLVSVSSYYLPHHKDYYNNKFIEVYLNADSSIYFTDHLIAVYGMDKNHLWIYDPVPSLYQGKISIEDFKKCFKGSSSIPELKDVPEIDSIGKFETVGLQLTKDYLKMGRKGIFASLVRTNAYEFMKGRIKEKRGANYFFGKNATIKFKNDLTEKLTTNNFDVRYFSKAIFEMRWSRYYFRDLLVDAPECFLKDVKPFLQLSEESIKLWEDFHKAYGQWIIMKMDNKTISQRSNNYFDKASILETRLYKGLNELFSSSSIIQAFQVIANDHSSDVYTNTACTK